MQKSIHKMQVRMHPSLFFEPGGGVGRELRKKKKRFGQGCVDLILVKTKPAYFASLLDKRLFCIAQIYFIYKKKSPWFL